MKITKVIILTGYSSSFVYRTRQCFLYIVSFISHSTNKYDYDIICDPQTTAYPIRNLRLGAKECLETFSTRRPFDLPRPSPWIERWISFLYRLQSSVHRSRAFPRVPPRVPLSVVQPSRSPIFVSPASNFFTMILHVLEAISGIFILFSFFRFSSFSLVAQSWFIDENETKCSAFELQGKRLYLCKKRRVCNRVSISVNASLLLRLYKNIRYKKFNDRIPSELKCISY